MSSTMTREGPSGRADWTVWGLLLGTLGGSITGSAYAASGFNPGSQDPLSLGTRLILIALPILGAVLGYSIAKSLQRFDE